jgi:hypothetical protein
MTIPKARLHELKQKLSEWQSPASFNAELVTVLGQMPSEQLFKQSGLTFLREAWVILYLAKVLGAEAVRLTDSEWPDAAIQIHSRVTEFEIVEALPCGRERGRENWNSSGPIHESIAQSLQIVGTIPAILAHAIRKKISKGYPPTASLVVYLNVSEWGLRQAEIEAALHDSTAMARNSFRQVWVFWKSRFYLLWDGGQRSEHRFESDYWKG